MENHRCLSEIGNRFKNLGSTSPPEPLGISCIIITTKLSNLLSDPSPMMNQENERMNLYRESHFFAPDVSILMVSGARLRQRYRPKTYCKQGIYRESTVDN